MPLFHHSVVLHVALVAGVERNNVQLGLSFILEHGKFALKHKFQQLGRVVFKCLDAVHKVKLLIDAKLFLALVFLNLVENFATAMA